MKRLPPEVQSLFCANSQINNYKRAVEELVFNSIDADATAIAVRISIQNNAIQVIDNGCGISQQDFNLLGQRNTTSKLIEASTLKSVPNKYGFRGESLANIIEVSECVIITSRRVNVDETWMKTFCKGHEKEIFETNNRPSKGTTVEARGFLYNLNIRKNTVNGLYEMQNIKSFLEQISLVHSNISFSLRDDSKNEIIFKINKNRDIYQTLSTLFQIEKADLQELSVEKNQYKIKAYIGKKDKEIGNYHWIYINGKLLHNSKIHSIVDKSMRKAIVLKKQPRNICKAKDDDHLRNDIPIYFIFVTCPYNEYELYTSKQPILEFKDWDQINKLLDKLIKFYAGETKVKAITDPNNAQVINEHDVRNQVKQIIDKVLGNKPNKIGVSQFHNGVKGKPIKRRQRKKVHSKCSIRAVSIKDPFNFAVPQIEANFANNPLRNEEAASSKCTALKAALKKPKKTLQNKKKEPDPQLKKHEDKSSSSFHKFQKRVLNSFCRDNRKKQKDFETKISDTHKNKYSPSLTFLKDGKAQKPYLKRKKDKVCKIAKSYKDPIIRKFEIDSGVKRRCDNLSKHIRDLLNNNVRICNKNAVNVGESNRTSIKYLSVAKKHHKSDYSISDSNQDVDITFRKMDSSCYKPRSCCIETVEYNNSYDKKDNVSVSKKLDKIFLDYRQIMITDQNKQDKCSFNTKKIKTSYDLLQTILEHQNLFSVSNTSVDKAKAQEAGNREINQPKDCFVPFFTFESHNYNKTRDKKNFNYAKLQQRNHNIHFISKQSKDNFKYRDKADTNYIKLKYVDVKNNRHQRKANIALNDNNKTNIFEEDSTYTIECTKSDKTSYHISHNYTRNTYDLYIEKEINPTYKISSKCKANYNLYTDTFTINYNSIQVSNKYFESKNSTREIYDPYDTYCTRKPKDTYLNNSLKSQNLSLSKEEVIINDVNRSDLKVFPSSLHTLSATFNVNVEPLKFCETVWDSNNDLQKELHSNYSAIGWSNTLCNFEDTFFNHDLNDTNSENNKNKKNNPCTETNEISAHLVSRNKSNHDSKTILEEVSKNHVDFEIKAVNNSKSEVNRDVKKVKNANEFNLKNRLRFIPKGMSPIFEHCNTKIICDYELADNYFKNGIYKNFANDVRMQSEVFEPPVHNPKNLTTRDIEKVNNKLNKDNASLIFDTEHLKRAKILRQMDCKFITAVIKGKCKKTNEESDYLVLFDQHAVHERITLEKYLSEYISECRWKHITVDGIHLKITKDQGTYLHNYKDKFSQLGLQWTALGIDVILITALPEAILGKNPRQFDVVMKTLKNLIVEEINTIQSQSGNISLYPKSIMDLVFSEACRNAIKFGDKLSKNDCIDLLTALSQCKTPFQCAHGRPVMAVIMEVQSSNHDYKINFTKLLHT